MLLYLVRHAHAVSAESNPNRPLSARGQGQCAQLAQFLRANRAFAPAYLLHSPLLRSIETAQHLQRALCPESLLLETPGLEPDDNPQGTLDYLLSRDDPAPLALIGHNNHLSLLASLLLSGRTSVEMCALENASVLALCSWDEKPSQNTPANWRLLWYIHPEILPAR